MYNVGSTIGSQYANSPIITGLINDWNAALDPLSNLQEFYSYVWDIQSAQGFGLDNWGEILGISRYLTLPDVGAYFGFNNVDEDEAPFGQAPFYMGEAVTNTFALSDTVYRQLLLAKALANISNCSLASLNQLAQSVFGLGAMCVLDLGGMQMAYVFATTPSQENLAIAQNSGVLPHPTGVKVNLRTAMLYNAVLTAGQSGSNIGFDSGSFGTLTPSTDANSNTIVECVYNSGSDTLTLQIHSGSTLTSSYFNTLTMGGISLAASAATFTSVGGGVYQWVWASSPIVLTNGANDSLLIT